MELSILQLGRQRTKDRAKVIARLNTYLSKLSVSISYDGALKFSDVVTCGISSTDTTQHKIFAFECDIEHECPIEPYVLTVIEVAELARNYLRSKAIDCPSDKYIVFLVSPLQKDIKQGDKLNAKYRAIVNIPSNEKFSPGLSPSDPGSTTRMPHIFFARNIELLAPMENKDGSSAVVNTIEICESFRSFNRFVMGAFVDKARPMPSYAALFVYTNVESLECFIDFIGEILRNLLGAVSGKIILLFLI